MKGGDGDVIKHVYTSPPTNPGSAEHLAANQGDICFLTKLDHSPLNRLILGRIWVPLRDQTFLLTVMKNWKTSIKKKRVDSDGKVLHELTLDAQTYKYRQPTGFNRRSLLVAVSLEILLEASKKEEYPCWWI